MNDITTAGNGNSTYSGYQYAEGHALTDANGVSVTNTPNYKQRMATEYREVKERYDKLHRLLIKYEAGTLNFPLACPVDLLKEQKCHMGEYLRVLEIRAEIEGVQL